MRRVMRARKVLPSISEHGSASFAAAAAVGPAPMAPGGSPRVVPETSLAPLEWDVFFDKKLDVSISEQDIFCVYTKGDAGPMFFLLHGGGYSGLTWACLTEELSTLAQCRIVAPDLRGHGNTVTADELDLSTERQIEDIVAIHKKICGDESVPTIVVGHSMGGALAVHAVASGRIKDAVALTVIDVVEGTAMEALNTMKHFLRNRPQKFGTVGAAIEWCSKSGTAKNVRAAQVSMPAQIRKIGDLYTWRIDLAKTEPHWVGWFKDLSKLFLSCPVPKLLVLAGSDRLDTNLIIGQMQGKFQETILPKAGHAVQEDSPQELAETLAHFAIRNQICQPPKW